MKSLPLVSRLLLGLMVLTVAGSAWAQEVRQIQTEGVAAIQGGAVQAHDQALEDALRFWISGPAGVARSNFFSRGSAPLTSSNPSSPALRIPRRLVLMSRA